MTLGKNLKALQNKSMNREKDQFQTRLLKYNALYYLEVKISLESAFLIISS